MDDNEYYKVNVTQSEEKISKMYKITCKGE